MKRGVSDAGFVANDVEIEQVLDVGLDWRTGKPLVSSMVQVRGWQSIAVPQVVRNCMTVGILSLCSSICAWFETVIVKKLTS